MSEVRYTLEEAIAELNRRQCAGLGHLWEVVEDGTGAPIKVFCSTCGVSHDVVRTAP